MKSKSDYKIFITFIISRFEQIEFLVMSIILVINERDCDIT